jgi:hypothetical protein
VIKHSLKNRFLLQSFEFCIPRHPIIRWYIILRTESIVKRTKIISKNYITTWTGPLFTFSFSSQCDGRAIAQASDSGDTGSIAAQVMWDLWRTKWHWGSFSPSTSVSPTNSHSAKRSILIYHPGMVQQAKKWPPYQVDSVSPHDKKETCFTKTGSTILKLWGWVYRQLHDRISLIL